MRKFQILSFSILLLAAVSCKKGNVVEPPIIDPPVNVEYACSNDGDIFKIFPDTMFVNQEGLFYKWENEIFELNSAEGISFGLFTCEGMLLDRNNPINSPLAWKISLAGNTNSDTLYATQGTVLLNDVLLSQDIESLKSMADGEEIQYQISLLNFNEEIIQTSAITVIHKEALR